MRCIQSPSVPKRSLCGKPMMGHRVEIEFRREVMRIADEVATDIADGEGYDLCSECLHLMTTLVILYK